MNGAVNDLVLMLINYFNALFSNDLIKYLASFFIVFCALGFLRRIIKINS